MSLLFPFTFISNAKQKVWCIFSSFPRWILWPRMNEATSKTSLQIILPESWNGEVFFNGLSVFKPSYLWLWDPSEEAGKLHCKTCFKMSSLALKLLEIRIDLFTRAAFFYRPSEWTSQRWWQCLWHFVVNQPRKSRRGLNCKRKCKGKDVKNLSDFEIFFAPFRQDMGWGRQYLPVNTFFCNLLTFKINKET